MPHQNTTSSRATAQNSVVGYTPGNDKGREENASVHPEPRTYAAPNVSDSTLAPPAAGEMPEYDDEGAALDMAGGQQGRNHANRPMKTEAERGQGPKTRKANRKIVKSGRAD
jgi:hypothetical protein